MKQEPVFHVCIIPRGDALPVAVFIKGNRHDKDFGVYVKPGGVICMG